MATSQAYPELCVRNCFVDPVTFCASLSYIGACI